jgi:hypothetical protein
MIKKTNARHGDFYIFTNDIFISRCLDLYGEWSVKSLASSLSYLYEGHKVLELAACGLKLEACCSTLEACRLHLEQLGA